MKKALFLLLLLTCFNSVMAQTYSYKNEKYDIIDIYKDVENLDFYGVDFSKAKVFGAQESVLQFIDAFKGINRLFISERSKYNLPKFLYKDKVAVHIDHLEDSYKQINADSLHTNSDDHTIDLEDIKSMVKGYNVESKYKIGVVLISELLNKADGYATYHLTFFDNKTKEVISVYPMSCKVGGFGLRNFWAKSVYVALSSVKSTMK